MKEIIPRWEWRTFGERFGAVESRFAGLVPEGIQESDEVYLLSPASDANVKVRDGLLDVKALQQVNADGLEQWKPVMKSAFPLSGQDAAKVFSILGIAPPTPSRTAWSRDELQAELARAPGGATAVAVHKRRTRYVVDGCMAEVAELVVDGKALRTIAFEHTDPTRVITTVRGLGLTGVPNLSYPRGLASLVGAKG